MDPLLLRSAFRIGIVIVVVSIAILPFQDRNSAEFVVTVLALIVGLVFTLIVAFLARSTLPPASRTGRQNAVDKAQVKGYNDRDSRSGGIR